MSVTFSPTIIAKPEIEFREELSHSICWLEVLDFEIVQSTPEMLIYARFCFLAEGFSLQKVVWGLKWTLPWILLFWVLAMLVVQSCCFAICFPPQIFHPTFSLWAFVLVGSGVQVRSGYWGSIGSSLGVSSGGGAPITLSTSRSLIDSFSMVTQVHLL
jgi:hypothetical protein